MYRIEHMNLFTNLKRKFGKLTRKPQFNKEIITITFIGGVILFFVALPFYMGTVIYPLAIVNGNSMYPNLHNGDLVLFHSPSNPNAVANGTIIVYVNTETGISGFDSFTKPIIIHRIIDIEKQSDGTVVYQTKGDNNLVPDPALVPSNHVIGTPLLIIPYVGLIFLFIQSPQGLVAVIGFITIGYLTKYENSSKQERKKEAFLGALARMSLNNEISENQFKKFELAVKYIDDLKINDLTDGRVVALIDWLKRGGLERGWKLEDLKCPECGSKAQVFESKNDLMLVICSNCQSNRS
jgi:signal peptidase I